MTDQPRKTGRPRKAPTEARTERLSGLRLTMAERQIVELMAERAGLDVAEFCRRAILGQRINARRNKGSDAALVALNRVGVNLNQIAARVNMTGDLAMDFAAVLSEVREAVERIAADGA